MGIVRYILAIWAQFPPILNLLKLIDYEVSYFVKRGQ